MGGNKQGKGGFGDHPENINRKGRPIDETLTDTLREFALAEESGIDRKKEIAERLWALAMEGNVVALKYVYDRLEGAPRQTIEMHNEKDAEWLELFKEIKDEAKSETANDPNSIREGKAEDTDS